jgi:hypothetical protein
MFDYCFLPSVGLSGGIILAWRTDVWAFSEASTQQFSVTAKATLHNAAAAPWWITVVYGPQDDDEKVQFLSSLVHVRASCPEAWLLCGDFNIIYREGDKSNGRLDHRGMRHFRAFINRVAIDELHLEGHRFTWSNRRDNPTLECLDRVFASPEWIAQQPNHLLKALSSDCSDHCPLLLQTNILLWAKGRFRFESFWTKLPDFEAVVEAGWSAALYHVDPFHALDIKLRSVAKTLKSWSAKRIGSIRLRLAIAREVILGLDVAEESRLLSDHEKRLRNELKFKCLGLASLNRTILRQRSKLLYLAEGDANTRFFHLQACHRNRKNTITRLRVDETVLVQNEELEAALHSHFDSLLGQPFQRLGNIGLHRLGLPTIDLNQLEVLFTEQEVWETIASMPPTGIFYKTAWPIIKVDIIRAFNAFWARDFRA